MSHETVILCLVSIGKVVNLFSICVMVYTLFNGWNVNDRKCVVSLHVDIVGWLE